MKESLKNVLETIDNYLATGDNMASIQLWSILSALRGPDSDTSVMKSATTSVIRKAAFPKTAKDSDELGGRVRASMSSDSIELVKVRTQARAAADAMDNGSHFLTHALAAFWALGLDWNNVNE